MKQYNIKPIRIRFISGGVECASLTQLRNNFVPKDVKDSYPQFLKWLRQNKEEDVINGLIASKDVLNEDNQDSLFCLYSILYKEYLFDNSIEDLYELFLKWHHNNKNNNTFIHLREEINSREWGELFFLDVVQKHIVSQTDIVSSSSSLFEIYKDFLFDYFENKKISNLIELYIHLASKSLYKENFVFLDNTIKSQEWQTNFYLELIPHLFLPNQKNKSKQSTYNLAFQTNINSLVNTVIVNSRAHVSDKVKGCGSNSYILFPLENISASFKSEDETYSFYKFFLGDFLSENKYNKLSDICLYFLESYMQNDNFKVLQEIIKTSEWKFDFTKECFPKIVDKIHQGIKLCPNKHTFLSVDNANQVFGIYKLFLEDFFRFKQITTLKELYEFWNLNKQSKTLFEQLHVAIVNSSWRTLFMNELVEDLFIAFKKDHQENNSASNAYSIDEKLFYTNFLCVYFDFYTKKRYINNISDIYIRWSKDPEFCDNKSFKFLHKILKSNTWGVGILLDIYKKHRDIYIDESWLVIFQELSKFKAIQPLHLFEIGRIYIEDYRMFNEGCHLLNMAIHSNNKEASLFYSKCVKKENNISEEFKKSFRLIDNLEWEEHNDGNKNFVVNQNLQSSAHTLREKWILKSQTIIHKIISEGEYGKIYDFVVFMRELSSSKDLPYNCALETEASSKKFMDIFNNTGWDKVDKERMKSVAQYNGKSFLELRFIFALLCMNYSQYKNEGLMILDSIKDLYLPANYLLNEKCKNAVLDKMNFRNSVKWNINNALKTYCQVMVLFANNS